MAFSDNLLWLRIWSSFKSAIDFFKTACRYYSNRAFRRADIALVKAYFLKNPYRVSRKFLEKRQAAEIYAYGETPLSSLENIVHECAITSADTIFELGSGRGRTCFWLALVLKAKVVGIDFVPEFIQIAETICQQQQIDNLKFICEDFLESDLKDATIIYLHGSCMEDADLSLLNQKFIKLKKSVKVITVSFPMSDYDLGNRWEILKVFPGSFSWGTTDVYLQVKL